MKTDNSAKLELLLQELIDSFSYTVMTDEKGNICKLSKNYADILEVDPEEVLGRHITEIIPKSGLPEVLKHGKKDIGQPFVLKNGERIICSRYPIRKNGEIIGAISTTIFDNLDVVVELNKEISELQRENIYYRRAVERLQNTIGAEPSFDDIVGETEVMMHLKQDVVKMAKTDATVLITGETGVGKELFANSIHHYSTRYEKPYVKINVAAIPDSLLESELFGYEKGAFSGASSQGKVGKFELADKGTLLLDEIGEMPLHLQTKLLRVIQEQEIERIGGVKSKKVDVRIICSTNRDLEQMVKEGLFRADLYYRIKVLELNVPPLRDRKDDLPELCRRVIQEINKKHKLNIMDISDEAIDYLKMYDWPGNVRELKHVLERAAIMNYDGVLKSEDFFFVQANMASQHIVQGGSLNKKESFEKEQIALLLRNTKGNKKRVAEQLGMSRSTLYRKIEKYKLF